MDTLINEWAHCFFNIKPAKDLDFFYKFANMFLCIKEKNQFCDDFISLLINLNEE